MAHFAKLDENNMVVQVVVVHNNDLLDDGVESEAKGIAFCKSLFGEDTRWVQTSYNKKFRKQYAGIGFIYDSIKDIFIAPKPVEGPDFVFDSTLNEWVPPIPRPNNIVCRWSFKTKSWIVLSQPYPSWVAQGTPLQWTPPIPYPNNGKHYRWDELTVSWIEVVNNG